MLNHFAEKNYNITLQFFVRSATACAMKKVFMCNHSKDIAERVLSLNREWTLLT